MPTMPGAPDAVIRQWFKDVWDDGHEDAIGRMLAPDARVHGLSGADGPPIIGAKDFTSFFRAFQSALSDISIVVQRTVVQDDMCAAFCRVTALHTGDTLGAPASGEMVDFSGISIARVRDGKIVEAWNCFDFLSMYQQIGWVRKPPLP
ncbi:MAG: ester cyclase [Acidobacteria bacterium]|nr:ester cyclase [Acidobacteriota bacterium]MCA1649888.1 ester cyclase [Acidobacteriota bacterium]